MNKEIIEGNTLIADFSAERINDRWYPSSITIVVSPEGARWEWRIGDELYMSYQLKYHSSWDWLMPVIEKIESLGIFVSIEGNECHIDSNDGTYSEVNCCTIGNKFEVNKSFDEKKLAVWSAVVEFIKWYNKK